METETGFDPALWRRMGGELGLQGLAVPEQYGGAGAGPVEVGVVMEEMGRALLCAPFLSSAVMATTALLLCDDEEARKTLLPGLAEGELGRHTRPDRGLRPLGPGRRHPHRPAGRRGGLAADRDTRTSSWTGPPPTCC